MKKSLILFFVLAALALFSLPVALLLAQSQKENITVTEEVLSGNPDAAAGVTLVMPSHWDGHLLWDTEYTIGDAESTRSKFHFSAQGVSWGWEWEKSAELFFSDSEDIPDWDLDLARSIPEFIYPKIATALSRKIGEESVTETFRIGDFYDIYPVTFRINGCSVNYGFYRNACRHLTEFFRIPTGNELFEVTGWKSYMGEKYYFTGKKVENEDDVSIVNASAFGETGFYYTYCLQNPTNMECVERGQNRGIFFFPYMKKDGDFITVELEKVVNLCEFPSDTVPLQMKLDEREEFLFLAAREKEADCLLVYHLKEEPVLQEKILLSQTAHSGSFCHMQFVEGGILFTWNDNYFSFVAGENGEYRHFYSGFFPETFAGENMQNPFPRENACLFDGNRLVISAFEDWDHLSVQLLVCDGEGVLYNGRYQSSQDAGNDPRFTAGSIAPQGARIWAPRSAWSSNAKDQVIAPLELKIK